jgi:hypothetical protein
MSRNRKLIILFILVILYQGQGWTQKLNLYQEKIKLSQEKEIIAFPVDLAVSEDECFIISDIKENKIILFSHSGDYLKSWKSLGQGPGEYQGMWWIDYNKPFFGLLDLRVQKIILYERVGLTEFKWIKDLYETNGSVKNFKIHNKKLILDVPVFLKNKFYFIHIYNIYNNEKEFFLPAAVRYKKAPENDYKKPDGEFRMLWGRPWSYIDVFEGFIYSAWNGMLNVIKINMTTKKWTSFGHESKNYSEPKVRKVTRQEREKASKWARNNIKKFSWITGIFADKNIIGLLYLNYNNRKSYWEPILQLYDGNGIFQKEEKLEGAQATDRILINQYSRDTGCLYVLQTIVSEMGEIDFEILKYQILN